MLTIQISRAIITSMKQESDVVLKSSNFRKHKKCSVFFTLISLLLLTVCSCMLFFILTKREPITAKEIFKDNIKSVVEVKAYSEDVGESFGTAEFVDDNGTLVTNAHVVTYTKLEETYEFESYFIRFASDENYIIVDLVKYDIDLDIAILKMDKDFRDFKPMKLGNSSKISTGDKVYAIGNSANYGLSMSEGIIGMPELNIVYSGKTRNVIQASINIAEGNSGGALLDKNGKLIGITTFRTKDGNNNVIHGIAYCVPINTVLKYINRS